MSASSTTKSTAANGTDSLPNKANADMEVVAVNGKQERCTKASTTTRTTKPPRWGPEPTLTSRKEMDVLYVLLQAVSTALTALDIDYIVTGGSLLGAVRQASILFCDDDVDISILDPHYYNDDDNDDDERSVYVTRVRPALQTALGPDFCYKQSAWEGGDRVYYGHSSVFVDLFVICKYNCVRDLEQVLSVKANGKPQSSAYVQGILSTIFTAAQKVGQEQQQQQQQQQDSSLPLLEPPFWHFAQRKAVELWPREVYRHWELWPLVRNLQMGPCTGICGPRLPVLLLQRAFGQDCFDVYYPSIQHNNGSGGGGAKGVVASSAVIEKKGVAPTSIDDMHMKDAKDATSNNANKSLPPKVLPGGTWEHATKTPLLEEHYIPIQPTSKAKRKPNHHCRQVLSEYLQRQRQVEAEIVEQHLAWRSIVASLVPQAAVIAVPQKESSRRQRRRQRPRRTVYMDGVFDLFHVGHLAAIRHCAARGDRVIIGVTGDQDAASYKRKPIICQYERCTIVAAMADVNEIVCPCPLIVTESFMQAYDIDLVVHGFLNDEDAQRQAEFFAYPVGVGKFERIPYYEGQSTTDIIKLIQAAPPMV